MSRYEKPTEEQRAELDSSVVTPPFVFSIRPKYVAKLLDGSKVWEYRTRRPKVEPGETILIYETAPRSMLVAEAKVKIVLVSTPADVWEATHERGGIEREDFDAYFKGHAEAVALHLIVTPIEPRPLPEGMAAPQSWARLKGESAQKRKPIAHEWKIVREYALFAVLHLKSGWTLHPHVPGYGCPATRPIKGDA